jgi:hypothetical protein
MINNSALIDMLFGAGIRIILIEQNWFYLLV